MQDAFHEGLGEVGGARIEDLFGDGGEVGDDVSAGIADAGEQPGVEVDAAVGEGGVDAGHINRRGAVGADGDGRGGLGRGDAGGAGEGGDVFVPNLLREGYVAISR